MPMQVWFVSLFEGEVWVQLPSIPLKRARIVTMRSCAIVCYPVRSQCVALFVRGVMLYFYLLQSIIPIILKWLPETRSTFMSTVSPFFTVSDSLIVSDNVRE